MSGAVFCLSLYHVCPAHSRKSVGSAGFHFGALSEEYPGWNDFLTFPTGFSTDFVKRSGVSHSVFHFFHRVFHRKLSFGLYTMYSKTGKEGKSGEKRGHRAFFEKEVEAENLFSAAFRAWGKSASPLWNFWRRSFPQTLPGKTMCGKPWKTRVFHKLRREKERPPGPDGPQRRWNSGKFIRPRRCRGRRLRR